MTNEAMTQSYADSPHTLSEDEMPFLLRLSEGLRRFVDKVGRFGSWFMLPL